MRGIAKGAKQGGERAAGFFAVVIPTYNRSALVARAIESVYATGWHDVEVIVVDDASTDDTLCVVASRYPEVRLLRMESNAGPGAARNLGIYAAASQWVVLLDDDDLLKPEALHAIYGILEQTGGLGQYPVVQFARSNAKLRAPVFVANLQDYIEGGLTGDFAAVIQTSVFRSLQLRYPDCRIGGENLLWYQIARTFGIPTWSIVVVQMTRDASSNLCSTASQIARPREYAELQEATLAAFGGELLRISPSFYRKKALGAIAYRLLAGDRKLARAAIFGDTRFGVRERIALASLSFMPHTLIRKTFEVYRRAGL